LGVRARENHDRVRKRWMVREKRLLGAMGEGVLGGERTRRSGSGSSGCKTRGGGSEGRAIEGDGGGHREIITVIISLRRRGSDRIVSMAVN
jgi:hypothetical protein